MPRIEPIIFKAKPSQAFNPSEPIIPALDPSKETVNIPSEEVTENTTPDSSLENAETVVVAPAEAESGGNPVAEENIQQINSDLDTLESVVIDAVPKRKSFRDKLKSFWGGLKNKFSKRKSNEPSGENNQDTADIDTNNNARFQDIDINLLNDEERSKSDIKEEENKGLKNKETEELKKEIQELHIEGLNISEEEAKNYSEAIQALNDSPDQAARILSRKNIDWKKFALVALGVSGTIYLGLPAVLSVIGYAGMGFGIVSSTTAAGATALGGTSWLAGLPLGLGTFKSIGLATATISGWGAYMGVGATAVSTGLGGTAAWLTRKIIKKPTFEKTKNKFENIELSEESLEQINILSNQIMDKIDDNFENFPLNGPGVNKLINETAKDLYIEQITNPKNDENGIKQGDPAYLGKFNYSLSENPLDINDIAIVLAGTAKLKGIVSEDEIIPKQEKNEKEEAIKACQKIISNLEGFNSGASDENKLGMLNFLKYKYNELEKSNPDITGTLEIIKYSNELSKILVDQDKYNIEQIKTIFSNRINTLNEYIAKLQQIQKIEAENLNDANFDKIHEVVKKYGDNIVKHGNEKFINFPSSNEAFKAIIHEIAFNRFEKQRINGNLQIGSDILDTNIDQDLEDSIKLAISSRIFPNRDQFVLKPTTPEINDNPEEKILRSLADAENGKGFNLRVDENTKKETLLIVKRKIDGYLNLPNSGLTDNKRAYLGDISKFCDVALESDFSADQVNSQFKIFDNKSKRLSNTKNPKSEEAPKSQETTESEEAPKPKEAQETPTDPKLQAQMMLDIHNKFIKDNENPTTDQITAYLDELINLTNNISKIMGTATVVKYGHVDLSRISRTLTDCKKKPTKSEVFPSINYDMYLLQSYLDDGKREIVKKEYDEEINSAINRIKKSNPRMVSSVNEDEWRDKLRIKFNKLYKDSRDKIVSENGTLNDKYKLSEELIHVANVFSDYETEDADKVRDFYDIVFQHYYGEEDEVDKATYFDLLTIQAYYEVRDSEETEPLIQESETSEPKETTESEEAPESEETHKPKEALEIPTDPKEQAQMMLDIINGNIGTGNSVIYRADVENLITELTNIVNDIAKTQKGSGQNENVKYGYSSLDSIKYAIKEAQNTINENPIDFNISTTLHRIRNQKPYLEQFIKNQSSDEDTKQPNPDIDKDYEINVSLQISDPTPETETLEPEETLEKKAEKFVEAQLDELIEDIKKAQEKNPENPTVIFDVLADNQRIINLQMDLLSDTKKGFHNLPQLGLQYQLEEILTTKLLEAKGLANTPENRAANEFDISTIGETDDNGNSTWNHETKIMVSQAFSQLVEDIKGESLEEIQNNNEEITNIKPPILRNVTNGELDNEDINPDYVDEESFSHPYTESETISNSLTENLDLSNVNIEKLSQVSLDQILEDTKKIYVNRTQLITQIDSHLSIGKHIGINSNFYFDIILLYNIVSSMKNDSYNNILDLIKEKVWNLNNQNVNSLIEDYNKLKSILA